MIRKSGYRFFEKIMLKQRDAMIRFDLSNHDLGRRLRLLARDGAIDGVDQHLGLDEFGARPLGLVTVEGSSEGFGKAVAVLGHALTRLFQRLKSLAHLGSLSLVARLGWRERQRQPPAFEIWLGQGAGNASVGP
jgi:hypothetical protein